MTADEFQKTIVEPGVAWCEAIQGWRVPFDDAAKVLLVAIGGQEGGWSYRTQTGGPARGFWQFEMGGGVRGVLTDPVTRDQASLACQAASVAANVPDVYAALAMHDYLALAFARLLLWSDARPLPSLGDQDEAWSYYERNWRPGAPGPDRWPANYQAALAVASDHAI